MAKNLLMKNELSLIFHQITPPVIQVLYISFVIIRTQFAIHSPRVILRYYTNIDSMSYDGII